MVLRTARPVRRLYPAPSPLLVMQRQAGLHPGGMRPTTLAHIARGHGLGYFGNSTLTAGVTGIKTGATTAALTTSIGTSVAGAIGAGAAAGSVVPIIGTAIGAIVGLFASGVFNQKKDPEDYNFQQASQMYRQNPNSVLSIANKYLVLAGLFDLQPGQIKGNIPIYKRYGNKGEYRFVTDLCGVIQSAANTGKITANDTPMTVFNHVVMPWIDSFGYGSMQDSNGDMINAIILGMTAEYLAGAQGRWYAVGGQYAFPSLPAFRLPTSPTQANAVSSSPPTYNPVSSISTSVNAPVLQGASFAPPGTVISGGQTTSLFTPFGTFTLTPSPGANGEYPAIWNGTLTGAGVQLLWDGITVFLKHGDGSVDRWNEVAWAPYKSASLSTPVPPTAPMPGSTPNVQLPAGFVLLTGASGSLPVYADTTTGTYYQLSGTTLSPYTGTLSASGQLIPITNGVVSQQAVTTLPAQPLPTPLPSVNPSLYQNTQAGVSTAPFQSAFNAPAASAPSSSGVSAAGVSNNLPWWIGGGLAVLTILLATGRPVGAYPQRSRRARN